MPLLLLNLGMSPGNSCGLGVELLRQEQWVDGGTIRTQKEEKDTVGDLEDRLYMSLLLILYPQKLTWCQQEEALRKYR